MSEATIPLRDSALSYSKSTREGEKLSSYESRKDSVISDLENTLRQDGHLPAITWGRTADKIEQQDEKWLRILLDGLEKTA